MVLHRPVETAGDFVHSPSSVIGKETVVVDRHFAIRDHNFEENEVGCKAAKVTRPSHGAPALKVSKLRRSHSSPFEAIGPAD
jgi:hypothetical protein